MDSRLQVRLASPLQLDSIVDGPGIRCVLWTQGCPHACKGCHNPQTHELHAGMLYDAAALIEEIKQAKLQNGLTLSGGEPFLQSQALLMVVKEAKKLGWNIWAYSGFTYEQLLADHEKKQLLALVDVLVDGRFIEEEKDYRLRFKGSRNQRIIDVQASLSNNSVVLSSYDTPNLSLSCSDEAL